MQTEVTNASGSGECKREWQMQTEVANASGSGECMTAEVANASGSDNWRINVIR